MLHYRSFFGRAAKRLSRPYFSQKITRFVAALSRLLSPSGRQNILPDLSGYRLPQPCSRPRWNDHAILHLKESYSAFSPFLQPFALSPFALSLFALSLFVQSLPSLPLR
jgi:hypothetical protein